ncbi:hypothetical protein [Dactylosporangium matsuzakiense]|uniref:Uncharacterized protein n=1 Tax=Dactylosporangium matsuzakiense TaxID=53360 RepID=A0A9W6KVL6_9ACTN|nr:hypothetical protein [Dactylosporangium matsuzakiense]GLL07220.1 hypothetical protein GCM10017581_089720 [Dactylosporangium matsuzakiense]
MSDHRSADARTLQPNARLPLASEPAALQRIADALLDHAGPGTPGRRGDGQPLIVDGERVGVVRPLQRTVLRHIARIELPGAPSLVWKRVMGPLRAETATLAALQPRHRAPGPAGMRGAATTVPVPALLAVARGPLADGLLLEDLGTPGPLPPHAWPATVRAIHATPVPAGLTVVDGAYLASLPARALAHLDALRADGVDRWPHSDRIAADLEELRRLGQHRSGGATIGPFGLCHGHLTPEALFTTTDGTVRVLGWGRACHGPGLLDLLGSLPLGTGSIDDAVDAHDGVLGAYLDHGGHPTAGHDRGGLPAARWAAGWYRVLHAERILATVAGWLDEPTDADHQREVGQLLTEAVQCLY